MVGSDLQEVIFDGGLCPVVTPPTGGADGPLLTGFPLVAENLWFSAGFSCVI